MIWFPKLLPLISLLIGGCITHRASVSPPPAADGRVVASAIGGEIGQQIPGDVERSGAYPQELPASVWLRDAKGNLLRAEARVQTPKPWWQRFPFDAVTDLLPVEFTVRAHAQLEAEPVPTMRIEELDAAAAAFGFGPD
ncbi:MAG: hypothetical protein EA402_03850 [Planctomycetota bacterium]|nr:MAG: hypothetical protein EA402_03850 [Planctomycetota bacterium]